MTLGHWLGVAVGGFPLLLLAIALGWSFFESIREGRLRPWFLAMLLGPAVLVGFFLLAAGLDPLRPGGWPRGYF